MKKRLSIFALFFLAVIAITYLYLIVNKPILIGVGYDPNTNEVILDFNNESIFPIYIDNVIVKNEDDTHINGKEFMYRLNSKRFNVTSDQLHSDLKSEVEFFEPFKTLYIQANDANISNGILIKEGDFKEINEVKLDIRVFGFLPIQVSREVDIDINKVEEN